MAWTGHNVNSLIDMVYRTREVGAQCDLGLFRTVIKVAGERMKLLLFWEVCLHALHTTR